MSESADEVNDMKYARLSCIPPNTLKSAAKLCDEETSRNPVVRKMPEFLPQRYNCLLLSETSVHGRNGYILFSIIPPSPPSLLRDKALP
jgi:hypothetical protein